ncbi:hypothetical protein CF129_08865 [Aeromonas dhakensis]|nr:hypothetical protein CF129_08865 [Aeromonas dhakensis]
MQHGALLVIVAGRLINHVWLENNLTVMAIKAVVAILFILVTTGSTARSWQAGRGQAALRRRLKRREAPRQKGSLAKEGADLSL